MNTPTKGGDQIFSGAEMLPNQQTEKVIKIRNHIPLKAHRTYTHLPDGEEKDRLKEAVRLSGFKEWRFLVNKKGDELVEVILPDSLGTIEIGSHIDMQTTQIKAMRQPGRGSYDLYELRPVVGITEENGTIFITLIASNKEVKKFTLEELFSEVPYSRARVYAKGGFNPSVVYVTSGEINGNDIEGRSQISIVPEIVVQGALSTLRRKLSAIFLK